MTVAASPLRHSGLPFAALCTAAVGVLFISYWDSLVQAVGKWSQDEYSHAYLIPVIAVVMARRLLLERPQRVWPAWSGAVLVLVAVAVQVIGELTALHTVVQYAFLVALLGLIIAAAGIRTALCIAPALIYLVFAIPLPNFLYIQLSSQMQLASSGLGVGMLHGLGVSVFREGNVIDFGGFRLQVVDACSGLRYLFPLLSFSYLAAFLTYDSWWKRGVIFLSAVPITILMNSLRIAVIGVTVEQWGIEMAQGIVHDLEGWTVFLFCLLLLAAEIRLLLAIGGGGRFRFDYLGLGSGDMLTGGLRPGGALAVATGLLALTAIGIGSGALAARAEILPERLSLTQFPLNRDPWIGRQQTLAPGVVEALRLHDYALTEYRDHRTGETVNFYVAYYQTQRKGASAHSPQTCIPGGGWEITSLTQRHLPEFSLRGAPLRVNRAVIELGEARQLVYYWFQQRGRLMTDEYTVKWNVMVDALTLRRTDGALVRMVTPLAPGEPEQAGEERMLRLLDILWPDLGHYVPE